MNIIKHQTEIDRLHDELQKNYTKLDKSINNWILIHGINLSNIEWIPGNRNNISSKICAFEEIAARAARSLLLIRYYRESILSIIPKDVIRMIAKKIYNMDKKSMISHIKFENNCEKIRKDRLTLMNLPNYKDKRSDEELEGNDYFNFEGSERNEKLAIYCRYFAGKHWNIIYKLFLGNKLYLEIIKKIADSYLKNEIPNEINPIYLEIFERIERHKIYWDKYRNTIDKSEEEEIIIKYIIDEKKFSNQLKEIKEFLNKEFPIHRNERKEEKELKKKEAEEKEKKKKEEYDNRKQYNKQLEAKEAKAKAKEAEKERKEQYIQYQKKLKAEAEEDEKAEKAENEQYRQKLKRKKNKRRKEKNKENNMKKE